MQQDTFTEGSIREQLARIHSSPAFKNSSILSGFLQFIVEEKLFGREQQIKEYTIGVNVLSRASDFNPQLNGVVRIHAHRLRRTLNEYYHNEGKHDPIRIEIRKGSYVPFFISPNGQTQETLFKQEIKSSRMRPVVAIFPFRNIGKNTSRDFFAEGLGEQLSTELTRFHELAVISYHSSRHVSIEIGNTKEAGKMLDAKYIITGSIQNDKQHLRVTVQLTLVENGQMLWAKTFEKTNTASGLFEIQNEIVKSILNAIGGYYGVIFKDVLNTSYTLPVNGLESYDAVLLYYSFQKDWNVENLQRTIKALEAAVKADPDYALAWAMLADLYPNDRILNLNKIDNPIELGLKCALRAVSIDPGCQHGYASLAWIYLFLRNKEECLKAAEKCIAINPNAADMLGAMGFVLSCAGEFERGFNLLNDANEHNPYYPWWYNLAYVFYFLSHKDYNHAWIWAEKIDKPELFWDPLLKSVILVNLNRLDEAATNLNYLRKLVPDTENQVKSSVESFLLSKDLNAIILEGLNKAEKRKDYTRADSRHLSN